MTTVTKKPAKKKPAKPTVKKKVVVREVIKKVIKEEYEVVQIPAMPKCMICKEHPELDKAYNGSFVIKCKKCGIRVHSKEFPNNLYLELCKTLKEWQNLFAHLQPKPEITNDGN